MKIKAGRLAAALATGVGIALVSPPWEIQAQAWVLLAIFISTILAVLLDAIPILPAALAGLAVSVLSGTLTPAQAYSGFSKGFILLILVAFVIAKGMIRSGLGARIATVLISRFGTSTLRLGYCIAATDMIIAPAFPSNTARSGILFPIAHALSIDTGSRAHDGTRLRTGRFLMFVSFASLKISSAFWLTAMAANPAGVAIARDLGVEIDFGTWLLAASVPGLVAIVVLPLVLMRLCPPELKQTPEAPAIAQARLKELGPMSRDERVMLGIFLVLMAGWASSGALGLDPAAIAFAGLAVLLLSGVYPLKAIKDECGDALETFLWFAILYTLSTYLNEFGFMSILGEKLSAPLTGLSWPVVYVLLTALYIVIHYFFVSQTAQLLALYGVFLTLSLRAGIPPYLAAFTYLFATNYFAALTPQASSANVIFVGSGYIEPQEVYRYGGLMTLVAFAVY
ncbi:MAG: DASS family sodium-coupled anion symporter, partial [Myxococcota bacterium]